MNEFIVRKSDNVKISNELILTNKQIVSAIDCANNAIKSLDDNTKTFDINIFEVMGLRNLSGLVGEYLVKSLQRVSNGKLQSNLHQDGYPDLLLTDTEEKKAYFDSLCTVRNGKKYPKEKYVFSHYPYGGIEVKATCGSTPPAKHVPKPLIGEQRISLINSFDWKAHHRGTNNLIGILWDFYREVPTIVAAFYRNDLTVDDWGRIVKPKEEGGRTTSVSIMNAAGVAKMCEGWIAVINDKPYIETLSKKKWIGYAVN